MKPTNYNRSQVMSSAWKMCKRGYGSFSYCLSTVWAFHKKSLKMTKVELSQAINNLKAQNRFGDYTERISVYEKELSTRETVVPVIRFVSPSLQESKAIELFYANN